MRRIGMGWGEGKKAEEGGWEELKALREEVEVKLVCNYSPTL